MSTHLPVQLALQDLAAFQAQLTVLLKSMETAASEKLGSRSALLEDLEIQANLFRKAGQALLATSIPAVILHQTKEQEIAEAKDALKQRIAKVQTLGKTLAECEQELTRDIKLTKALLPSASNNNGQVSLDWIVQSARKLSYTMHAPPNWYCEPFKILDQDYALPPRFHYSYPTEEEMKRNLMRTMLLRQQQPAQQDIVEAPAQPPTTTVAAAAVEEEQQVSVEPEMKRVKLEPPQPEEEEEEEEEEDFLGDL